jgi:GT2 family glycosyltransferase
VPDDGFPAFFFPEGACMVRREAYLAVGGYLPAFFFSGGEIDVSTKLLAAGYDVRYFPGAVFHHMKEPTARVARHDDFRLRIRNLLWYLFLRLPRSVAMRQAIGYLAFDFVQAVHQRSIGSWVGGIRDAWRQRDRVRGQRDPIPRSLVRRAGDHRAYAHRRYLVEKFRRRLRRQP